MLLDTNIVGYFFRGDSRARAYERHLTGQTRYIAFVTLGELYQWLLLRPFSEANKQGLLEHIARHVVVPYDDRLVWTWAELNAKNRQAGRIMSAEDSWIAATALRHRMALVTHNRKHFENVPGLTIISES
jgi:tRNA(fMet)-specific endonuclease VapC